MKIVPVQYARALAAILVLLSHTTSEALKLTPNGTTYPNPNDYFPFVAGVDVFFIISGFIMVLVSRNRWHERGYALAFLRDRITRIVPNYYFYTGLIILALLIVPSAFDTTTLELNRVLGSLLFFPGLGEPWAPILSLGWTLNFEMFFYLLFAIGILLLRTRAILSTCAALVAVSIVGQTIDGLEPPLSFWFNSIVLEFCIGMLFAEAWHRGWRAPGWVGMVSALVGVVLLALGQAYVPEAARLVRLGLPAALITLPFLFVENWPDPQRPSLRLLETVGDSSYTLYLSHPFVITVVFTIWERLLPFGSVWVWPFTIVTCVAAVAYAWIAWRLIELRITRVTRRLFSRQLPNDPPITKSAA